MTLAHLCAYATDPCNGCSARRPLLSHKFVVQGLLVKMITGDQALIGRETAKQLGMGTNIFNTEVLLKVSARA